MAKFNVFSAPDQPVEDFMKPYDYLDGLQSVGTVKAYADLAQAMREHRDATLASAAEHDLNERKEAFDQWYKSMALAGMGSGGGYGGGGYGGGYTSASGNDTLWLDSDKAKLVGTAEQIAARFRAGVTNPNVWSQQALNNITPALRAGSLDADVANEVRAILQKDAEDYYKALQNGDIDDTYTYPGYNIDPDMLRMAMQGNVRGAATNYAEDYFNDTMNLPSQAAWINNVSTPYEQTQPTVPQDTEEGSSWLSKIIAKF